MATSHEEFQDFSFPNELGCQKHQPIHHVPSHGVRRRRLGHLSTHRRPGRCGAGSFAGLSEGCRVACAAAVAREEVSMSRGYHNQSQSPLWPSMPPVTAFGRLQERTVFVLVATVLVDR
jgi:hypothetical protein